MAFAHEKKWGLVIGKKNCSQNVSVRHNNFQSFHIFLDINAGSSMLATSIG